MVSPRLSRIRRDVVLAPLFALAVLWSLSPLSHDDLFWHMRTGEIFLRDGVVPTTDPFSYTRAGEPWVSHEWGFGLLVFLVHQASGLVGVVALQVALTLSIFGSAWVLLARARPRVRGSERLIPAGLALALWAGSYELKLNPAPLTTLFLVWELLLLEELRRSGRRVHVASLALLFLVWGNVHGGVLFGILVLCFWWIEAWAPAWMPQLLSRFRRPPGHATAGVRLGLLVSALAISLLNPNGIETPLYPVRLSIFLFTTDLPLHMGHFTMPTPADRPGFFFFIVVLLAGLIPLARSRRLTIPEMLTVGMFLVLSLRSNRFILDFAVLASPALLKLHGELAVRRIGTFVPAAVTGALALSIVPAYRSLEPRLLSEEFPERAASFLEQERIRGNLLNHQNYGGYLGWRLRIPVFWDGRNDVFGALMKDLVGKSFPEIVDRYGVDVLLLTETQYAPLKDHLAGTEWGLVYWDDYCAVFVRRIPRFQALLERSEYQVFAPFGPPPDLQTLALDPGRLSDARAELDRVLAHNWESQRALYYRGLVSLYAGDLARARRELEEAARVRPNAVVDRTLLEVLGLLLARGQRTADSMEPFS